MKKELITFNEPKSPITENFKALRTNLQFMNAGKNIQVILVTSTLPSEGKTWNAANLAITFTQAGNKVLIIDADMRKGRQFSLFNVPPRPGLSNYLSGIVNSKTHIDINNPINFIKETEIENLHIIPSGDVPPNPSELLITTRMQNLLENLKNHYDTIIIDTPPAMLVTDSKILARLADISLIVASYKETKIDNLKKVKREIENVGGKIGGVILNKVPTQTKKYNGGYYYGETSLALKENKRQDIFIRSKSTLLDDRKSKKEEDKEESIENDRSINPYKEENNKNDRDINPYKEENTKPPKYNSEITIDKTQDILKQINNYLDEEKRKMNNGDKND